MRLAGAALGLAVVLAECGDSEPPDEAAPPVQTGQSTTVTYCHDETARITEPDHLGAAAPAAVYLHGGSWIGRTTPAVASSSTTSASPSTNRTSSLWRPTTGSSPEEPWPAQIVDAKCAVRYLRANAKALRVDPREIGVWGHGAGDHLASLAGTAPPSTGWVTGDYPAESSASRRSPTSRGRPTWSLWRKRAFRAWSRRTSCRSSGTSRRANCQQPSRPPAPPPSSRPATRPSSSSTPTTTASSAWGSRWRWPTQSKPHTCPPPSSSSTEEATPSTNRRPTGPEGD